MLCNSCVVHGAAGSLRDIDVVLRRLDEIIAWSIEQGSRVGYFAAMYRKVTAAVRQGIVDERFDDGARMALFDRVFAERFIDAFDAWQAGGPVSASWQVAFDASGERRLLILQHLLLGMNAHINLDLGIAAAAVAPGESIHALKPDFDAINDVLGSLVDGFEADVGDLSPWIGFLERVGGRSEDEFVRFSIEVARTSAWELALKLAGADDPASATSTIAQCDEVTAALGNAVRRPGRLLQLGLVPIRARETNDVVAVIERLS